MDIYFKKMFFPFLFMVSSAVPPLCLFSFGSYVCAGLGGIVGLSALLTFRKLGAVSKRNIVTTKFF